MRTRCIIMASGQSHRMGHNKLAIIVGGKTILEHVLENVSGSKLTDIVVVYGKYKIEAELPMSITTIFNADYEAGMSTSIIAGLKDYEGDSIIIVLGDMPFVKSDTINKMLEKAESSTKGIIIPCIGGQRGNPVLLKSCYFGQLRGNRGDKGAREIIRSNQQDIELCEVDDPGILIDIDDEQTLEKYIHSFEG